MLAFTRGGRAWSATSRTGSLAYLMAIAPMERLDAPRASTWTAEDISREAKRIRQASDRELARIAANIRRRTGG